MLTARGRTALWATLVALVAVTGFSLVNGLRAADPASPPKPAAAASPSPASAPTASGSAAPAAGSNIYAPAGAGKFAEATRGVPYLIYVPESAGFGVDVVDPIAMKVIAHYQTGSDPQHVVPAYDLRTLYATNTLANTITPFDPRTGKPAGPNIPVGDPYNLYFTPGGGEAVVVAEARRQLEFVDPHTFVPHTILPVQCAGVDHADFTADGRFMLASCEFAGRLVVVDLARHAVVRYVDLPGSSPQDVRLSADGSVFYVADMYRAGVHIIDAATFAELGFLPTGKDAHGLYPSRDGTRMFVSNRGAGSISVIDMATRTISATWHFLAGASPDMGGLSPDGKELWLSGRYNATIYKISTVDGRLLGQVPVPLKPHGLLVWPQPGRFSLGHTGIMR